MKYDASDPDGVRVQISAPGEAALCRGCGSMVFNMHGPPPEFFDDISEAKRDVTALAIGRALLNACEHSCVQAVGGARYDEFVANDLLSVDSVTSMPDGVHIPYAFLEAAIAKMEDLVDVKGPARVTGWAEGFFAAMECLGLNAAMKDDAAEPPR